MSIYSGFATRFQEESYDHCIDALLYVLQKRIIKFYMGEHAEEEKFISAVVRLHHQMQKMEKNKYLDPKSSESIRQLIHFMQIYQQNIIQNSHLPPSVSPETAPREPADSLSGHELNPTEAKKVSLWVQKAPKEFSNNQKVDKDVESIEPNSNDRDRPTQESRERSAAEFQRTKYHNRSIRGVRMKNVGPINLSREKDGSNKSSSNLGINKISKSRATSNYQRQKPTVISSKISNDCISPDNSAIISRRFSSGKATPYGLVPGELKPAASTNEVADIIKDYIMKSKKNRRSDRHSKNNIELYGRLNDF